MVAHGTIAFDTLTTSDQKKTGTEKSLDTSYIFNGVAKVWLNYDHGNSAIKDSVNISSVTDNSTGVHTPSFTSNMANSNYAITLTTKDGSGVNAQWTYESEGTSSFIYNSADDSGSGYTWTDYAGNSSIIKGDLA